MSDGEIIIFDKEKSRGAGLNAYSLLTNPSVATHGIQTVLRCMGNVRCTGTWNTAGYWDCLPRYVVQSKS